MTKEEFNLALAKCEHHLDFMVLAKKVANDDVRLFLVIKEAYWRGYERSTKNALHAIERSVNEAVRLVK